MILIKHGRVINPQTQFDEIADILIEDSKIKKIGQIDNIKADQVIDAKGMIISPGLIDVHVHFRDPGFTYKEDIESGCRAAAAGGFTTVVCMANTWPVVDNADTLTYILEKAKEMPIRVIQTSTITKGLKGQELVDMKAQKAAGAMGFTDDGIPIMNASVLYEAMLCAKELNVPISLHEEDPSLIIQSGVNYGEISQQLNFGGAKRVSEDIMVARDCMLALDTGASVDIQHISSKNAVELVRHAKSMGANIVAEACPHHFTLTEEDVLIHGSLAKMNPPLRTKEDRSAIIEGLVDNTIEIIATDHAPHSSEEKERGLQKAPSGIIGLETSLALGITQLVNSGHLTLMHLLEKMTINPAQLYHLDAGYIAEQGPADLVIINQDETFTLTSSESKSINTPFLGQELTGKVKYTICQGKVVYRDK